MIDRLIELKPALKILVAQDHINLDNYLTGNQWTQLASINFKNLWRVRPTLQFLYYH